MVSLVPLSLLGRVGLPPFILLLLLPPFMLLKVLYMYGECL